MPSTTLARGNALQTFYVGPSLTPAAVATATTAAQTYIQLNTTADCPTILFPT